MTQPAETDEKGVLVAYLNAQRRHVLEILEGLADEDMHRAVLPSGWTPVGLVNHLALDDERFWFQAVVAGEQSAIESIENESDSWKVSPDTPASDIVDLYRQEIERSNAVIASTPLDTAPAWWPDFFGTFRLDNLRDVLLHVITETACHAGHADAARELIDGKRWMVLTE
ncbi:MAG TPA: DinB family protein [Chloroflexota bacterium]|nr:DinB family protein [Chloroflexota bacterium]